MESEMTREILWWLVVVTVGVSLVAVTLAALTVIRFLLEGWLREGSGPLEW